jgi:hypothetical protein
MRHLLFLIALALAADATPAQGADLPLACKPFSGMERSCTSVKAIVAVMGEKRAEQLARKCGATDQDIEQAKTCLQPK